MMENLGMRIKVMSVMVLMVFGLGVFAQNSHIAKGTKYSNVRVDESTNTVSFVRFRSGQEINYAYYGQNWLNKILKMQENDNLVLIRTETDQLGWIHYRFMQTYKGYPVEGSMYIVHTKNGRIISANGNFIPELKVNTKAGFDEDLALKSAINSVGADVYNWNRTSNTRSSSNTDYPEGQLVVVYNKNNDQYELAYKFDIFALEPVSRQNVYVNAEDGNLISKMPTLSYLNEQTNVTTHYSGVREITHENSDGTYYLKETTRGNGIQTLNMKNGQDFGAAVDFTSTSSTWDNMSNVDDAALDAHWTAEMSYDYIFNVQGRNSLDGQGMIITSYIHFDNNMANAFWTGDGMAYGDGDGSTGPFTTFDICAHEFTHGLTQFSANLQMGGESAALNESFSDIFSTTIEKYSKPELPDSLNYTIGEDIISGGIRSLANPKKYNMANTYMGQNWDNTGQNNYANGAVQSFWYYILINGKSGVNDNDDSYTVNGIGREKAAKIAFRNLTAYLTPNSDFEDARFYAIQAAMDLYGGCSDELKATTNAWYAVGVGDGYSDELAVDFEYEKEICSSPTIIKFLNNSTGAATYTWDFGDGQTSNDMAPAHVYTSEGTYSVKLSATGCLGGNDEKTIGSIIIDNSVICDTLIIPVSGTLDPSSACNGIIMDNGGDSNYAPNANGFVTISVPDGNTIKLNFMNFDYQFLSDNIRVFDGTSTTDPVLGTFSFMQKPEAPIVSTGSSISIQESTDQMMEGSGFMAFWECLESTSMEDIDLDSKVTIYPNPSGGKVFIDVDFDWDQEVKMQIYNLLGEVVYEDNNFYGGNMEVDLNMQPEGLYIINIDIDNEKIVKRVSIVK